MKKALIIQGGWTGHEPVQVSTRFAEFLRGEDFEVEVSDTLESLENLDKLLELDLIVPVWTMAKITKEQEQNVSKAIATGVGIAGCHGGMCDAFRESTLWQFITGGNWVSHPGGDGITYTVNIKNSSSPLVQDVSDFKLTSEHYYLHVDPAVEVLATTRFPSVKWYHSTNKEVDMPVVWTKHWGHGRVYYNALGHVDNVFDVPEVFELMKRGLLWAAEGKQAAIDKGLSIAEFESDAKMF